MITLNNITLRRGVKTLLQNVNLSFYNRQKIGIAGKNGCGKTSLFLMLLNKIDTSNGGISLPSKLKVATIEQEIPESARMAIEYVIDADTQLRACEFALQVAEQNHDTHVIAEKYEELQDIDGFTAEARAGKILHGLGFVDENMWQPVNSLSGGWRMRINIARALFVPSDLLLLDEPTNHLDLDAVIWLEKWLKKYSGLLLLISHDREFLDKITTHIVYIENKQANLYTGNYSDFEKQRATALALQQKSYEKQQKHIEHIEAYIRRFKAKATKARQAQSRVKALERMELIMPAHIDSPFDFEFKEPNSLSNPLLTMKNVTFSYGDNLVLDKIDFQLNNQDRIGLLGINGAGKSTFIKLLAGDLQPKSGTMSNNKNLMIGYFAQHTLEMLDKQASALRQLQKIAPNKSELELRKFLGGFDFSGDQSTSLIENFSGGEKARLALALIVWQSPNILLLDEPTNHLDIDMRQALILALQNYSGAVIVVSHDRFLLNQVVDDYYLVANKSVANFDGGLEAYQSWVAEDKTVAVNNAGNKKQVSQVRKNIVVLERKLDKLHKDVAKLDQELLDLNSDAGWNTEELQKKYASRQQLENQAKESEREWVEQTEILERLQGGK